MGGHGGLNILPQKRWNVYNWDNRDKVKRDEDAAAREHQLRLDQSRRAEADLRLQSLRRARGLASASASASTPSTSEPVAAAPDSGHVDRKEADSRHMNLFDSLPDFEFLGSVHRRDTKKAKRQEAAGSDKKDHKRRREEKEKAKEAKIIAPEDEKYRLGYGLAGKGVHKPWYLTKPASYEEALDGDKEASRLEGKSKKKSIEELREERMRRERTEKKRERKLLRLAGRKGFSR